MISLLFSSFFLLIAYYRRYIRFFFFFFSHCTFNRSGVDKFWALLFVLVDDPC